MKMGFCPNKHFYDADKYDSCPHCQQENASRRGDPVGRPGTSKTGSPVKPEAKKTSPTDVPPVPATVSIYGGHPIGPPDSPPAFSPFHGEHPANPPAPQRADPPPRPAPAGDDGHTIGFYGDKSTPHYVVGWLVCIEGPEKGRSFPLKDGKNFIGRAPGMDIQLSDPKVSQFKHAYVQFDPGSNTFKAAEGDSGALTWLNSQTESLEGKPTMRKGDILKVGGSRLLLIPFCDDSFRWDTMP